MQKIHPLTIKFSNCLACTSCCVFVCRAAKIYNFWRSCLGRMFAVGQDGQDALEMASLPLALLYGPQLEFKAALKGHLHMYSLGGFTFDVLMPEIVWPVKRVALKIHRPSYPFHLSRAEIHSHPSTPLVVRGHSCPLCWRHGKNPTPGKKTFW